VSGSNALPNAAPRTTPAVDVLLWSQALLICYVLAVRLTGGYAQTLLSRGTNDKLVLAADLATILLFISGLLNRLGKPSELNVSGKLFATLLVLFALGTLNPDVGRPLSIFGLRSMTLPLLTLFAYRFVGLDHRQHKLVARVFYVLAMANFLTVMRQATNGLNPEEARMLVTNGSTFLVAGSFRLPGLLASGQDLSLLAGGIAAWAITKSISRGWKEAGLSILLLAVMSGFSIAVALQRGPLIAMVLSVAIGLLSLSLRSGKGAVRVALALVVGAAVVAVSVSAFASSSAERARDVGGLIDTFGNLASDRSYQQRLAQTIPTSIKLVAANPVIGYGTGASGPSATARADQSPLQAFPLGGLVADNGYLLVALQLGVPGAMLFAFALGMGARRGAITGRQTYGEVNYEVRAIFLFLMVAMLFGGYWGLSGPMCVLLGIVAREDRFHHEQAHSSRPESSSMRRMSSSPV
jgi:O-Antigen ligase